MPSFAITLLIMLSHSFITDKQDGYDSRKSPAVMAMSYGYAFEEHKAITPDNYILTIWRIPGKLHGPQNTGPVVFLMHGVLDNAFTYFLKGNATQNLPYVLSDLGYDVWLGNNRGTIRSYEHLDIENYNWEDVTGKYWDFSVDELAKYDVPTMVDLVLKKTHHEKLNYIGHSQGTAQFFMLSCMDPTYINEHISSFIGLGPIIFSNQSNGVVTKIIDKFKIFDILYSFSLKNILTSHLFLPLQRYVGKLMPGIIEEYIVAAIVGNTKEKHFDVSRMPTMLSNEPGGTSAQNMLHWVQMMRTGEFKKFDYGNEGNLEHYGSFESPFYDLRNLKKIRGIPIELYVGNADALISEADIAHLMEVVPDSAVLHWVDDYAHLDYVWSKTAYEDIYVDVTKFLGKYQPSNN